MTFLICVLLPSAEKKSANRKIAVCIGAGVLIPIAVTEVPVALSHQSNGTCVDAGSTNTTNSSTTEAPAHVESPEEVHVKNPLPDCTMQVLAHNGMSPKSQAFQWVVADPSINWRMQQGEDWRVQHRFALATLCHAAGGEDSWLNTTCWLSYDIHECLWCAAPDFGWVFAVLETSLPTTFTCGNSRIHEKKVGCKV